MGRYVLRYIGSQSHLIGSSRVDTCEAVVQAGGRVLDDAPTMLLVEGPSTLKRALKQLLPDWQLAPESLTPVPAVPRPQLQNATRARRR
jgi:hypothetical protein